MNTPLALDSIPVLVVSEPSGEDTDAKRLFGSRRSEDLVLRQIPVERLQEQLASLSLTVAQLLDTPAPKSAGRLQLNQITVQVEITASGGINLIGTAAVGGTAAITLTFSK